MKEKKNLKTLNPNIKKIFVVASGKGGVGKSTTALNLARNMTDQGYKIGIIDADIYGSTITHFLEDKKQIVKFSDKHKLFMPIVYKNINFISVANFIDDTNDAVLWRGPMLSKFIKKLLDEIYWQNVEILIIDTPPGTGDILITLMSEYMLDGCILIATQDNISYIGINKTKRLLELFNVKNLGIVENLCHEKYDMIKNNYLNNEKNKNIIQRVPYSIEIRESNNLCYEYNKDLISKYYTTIVKKIMI
ncbi:Mrp/NBP35 family ATP-binding protein [Anaplasmataceae bacterium AB001_6]|nr:Mrp/NBP35 family ATP-binding protein [Anaplasmataceae bacterium AB001_6]